MRNLRREIRKIIKEELSNGNISFSYAQDVRDELEKVLKRSNLRGWKLHVDPQSGSFEFYHPVHPYSIFSTPFWNEDSVLGVDVYEDGDVTQKSKIIQKLHDKKYKIYPNGILEDDVMAAKMVILKLLGNINRFLD